MTIEGLPPEPKRTEQLSPRWNWTTKLVVGLALVAVAIWLLVQFQNFLGPILLAFILAYLLYPVADFLKRVIKIPWRLAVTLIYVLLVLILLGLLTWGGLALSDQIANLIDFISKNIDQLPDIVDQFTQTVYTIGNFEFSLAGINWDSITNEIVGMVRPVVGQMGSIAGSLASGAASGFLWFGILFLVSYFLLTETEGISNSFFNFRIPGYDDDIKRMGKELSKIWNAFVRGQMIIELITVAVFTVFLGFMGVEFFFGLALIAALGRFVPYVGAWFTWIAFGLVALFQGGTIFGLSSGIYALIILGSSMVIDTMLDNYVQPKVMSVNLKIHPALVLVGALVAVNLLGIVGLLLAAPVLATFKLIFGYILRKLSDQDPWELIDNQEQPKKAKWVLFIESLWEIITDWFKRVWKNIVGWFRQREQKGKVATIPKDDSSEE